jgi:hypothetical protein
LPKQLIPADSQDIHNCYTLRGDNTKPIRATERKSKHSWLERWVDRKKPARNEDSGEVRIFEDFPNFFAFCFF